MNRQNFPTIPDENRIEELLTKFQPVPSAGFHQKMKQAAWKLDSADRGGARRARWKMAVTIVTAAMLTVLFATPQGRAWAQEVFQFFRKVDARTIPLPKDVWEKMFVPSEQYELPLADVLPPTLSPELAKLPECQAPEGVQSYACQIAHSESLLGFDLMELPAPPDGWEFESVYFDEIRKMAYINYRMSFGYNSYGQLILIQTLGKEKDMIYSSGWTPVVPASEVEVVKVGPYSGEYVQGWFVPSNNTNELVWDDSSGQQRLAWSDGTRWYLIEIFATSSTNSIDRDDLIELASSVVDKPVKQEKTLDPNFLYSISDAEELSGLDLKAPTLLPIGIEFSSAKYIPGSDKVLLRYGAGEELVIHEWKGKPTDFKPLSPSSNPDYEIVQIHGRNAFYAFSAGTSPYQFLWWSEGELNYQIYFYEYLFIGGVLNKEKMIAIAESMSDINDFRGNIYRPYEYVRIYEQSLGFDVQEFQTEPAEWSFTNVAVYTHPDCVQVSYMAKQGIGRLSIRQCSTDADKFLAGFDIPGDAIERVRMGRNEGQYILGNYELNDGAKMVWNPNLPFRRLLWQENGVWMQIMLSGDSVFLYDKEDLIALAESLR